MKTSVVVGLGFGDEGKGLVTDYLCQNAVKPVVVRFNGGHQAGHTVVTKEGLKHTFSNFGAGTFRGVATYWSAYCTFFPEGVLSEFDTLSVKPKLFIDRNCAVTTHYDILFNRAVERSLPNAQRGSCGLGFGATVRRQQFPHVRIDVNDLLDRNTCKDKLRITRAYYKEMLNAKSAYNFDQFDHDREDKRFFSNMDQLYHLMNAGSLQVVSVNEVLSIGAGYETFVFEGAQGIMLDQNLGFVPYITQSNTTSQNAIKLIERHLPSETEVEIIYVTRCYHTRHGAGPLAASVQKPSLKYTDEANIFNEFQRDFRISYLDINLLNYALKCDATFSKHFNKHLIVTCLDQLIDNNLQCYLDGKLITLKYAALPKLLDCKFSTCRFSFSNCSANLNEKRLICSLPQLTTVKGYNDD